MISVAQALAQVLALFNPLDAETVPLENAGGRVMAGPVFANRNQPPFASSAMDGYAVFSTDIKSGATLDVIGESTAGARFDGTLKTGTAVRIFTGAPVPKGADRIIIQEDCTRNGHTITVGENLSTQSFIRPDGTDFTKGSEFFVKRRLTASDISLLAAMNIADVAVYRKPIIALVPTGDELVGVGGTPNRDQIISSNNYGLKYLIEQSGGIARMLPIAHDNAADLKSVLEMGSGCDAIITLGGASVGDYDLVQDVAIDMGFKPDFYKVAMRPGKPLMAGRMGDTPMIGLPGNPVSALVCAHIFLRPALSKMMGLGADALPRQNAILGCDIGENGPREHYVRCVTHVAENQLICTPFDRQDSALLSVISQANALMIRAPNAPALKVNDMVQVISI